MNSARMLRLAAACGFLLALGAAGGPCRAQDGELLQGTARWDLDLVRDYFRQSQGIELPAEPTFVNSGMLSRVNPEFAHRVRVLLAVYEAQGGRSDAAIGLIRDTGGLRDAALQRRLWSLGRRIRLEPRLFEGMFLTMPAGDGSRPDHWELIPVAERNAKNSGEFRERGRTTYGPVTNAWISYHNLGLAVDVGVARNAAFRKVTQAAADLGMIWGGWFGSRPEEVERVCLLGRDPSYAGRSETPGWDEGHFEWHPGVRDAAALEGSMGKALGTDQLHTGYAWKLPATIYVRPSGSRGRTLFVHQLGADASWIVLRRMRMVTGDPAGQWSGAWYTYDPPVRLFPVYIPTITLSSPRSGAEPPAMTTTIRMKLYNRIVASNGQVSFQHFDYEGACEYRPDYRLNNWENFAVQYGWRKDPGWERFRRFRDTSEYDVSTSISLRSVQPVTVQSRDVDADGYTSDHDGTLAAGTWRSNVSLSCAWNRDRGKIGVPHQNTAWDNWDLVETYDFGSGTSSGSPLTVAPRLPEGAFDRPEAPEWTAAKLRPPVPSRPSDGILPK